jgi:hypothetical protein
VDIKAIRKFFKPGSEGNKLSGVILIVLGAVNLPFVFLGMIFNALIGAGCLALGLFLYKGASNNTMGYQLDQALVAEENKALDQALSKLGLDRDELGSVEPLVVSGYRFTGLPMGTMAKQEKSTGKWRSPIGEVAVIIFSDDVLHSYKRIFSFVDPSFKAEETDEYFYKDVVSISTKSEAVELPGIGKMKPTVTFESLSLTTSGGTSVKCSIYKTDEKTERALGAARTLVKEKKR